MRLTQWIEDSTEGVHPPGSYEANQAIRRVFAKMNPSLDYDETMTRLKAERGIRYAPEPETAMLTCSTCGILFVRSPYGPAANHCGPCASTILRMRRFNSR